MPFMIKAVSSITSTKIRDKFYTIFANSLTPIAGKIPPRIFVNKESVIPLKTPISLIPSQETRLTTFWRNLHCHLKATVYW